MSSVPPEDSTPTPSADDTAAFQRYYLAGDAASPPARSRSLLYRLLIGWWKER